MIILIRYDDFVFLSVSKVFIQGISMPFVGDWSRELGCKWSIFIGSGIYRLLSYHLHEYIFFIKFIFQCWLHIDLLDSEILLFSGSDHFVSSWHWVLFHLCYCSGGCTKMVSQVNERLRWKYSSLGLWIWISDMDSSADVICESR